MGHFSEYMRKVYFWTISSFLGTILLSYYLSTYGSFTRGQHRNWTTTAAAMTAIIASMIFSYLPPQYAPVSSGSDNDRHPVMVARYPLAKWVGYFLMLFSNSWLLATHFQGVAAEIVYISTLTCIISLLTTTYISFHWVDSDSDYLLFLQVPITQGLNCLLGVSVLGLGAWWFGGVSHPLFLLCYQTKTYIGLVIFCLYLSYHTHMAAVMYQKRTPDYLGCAMQLYMDLLHIFIRILDLLSERERERERHQQQRRVHHNRRLQRRRQ